MSGRPGQPPGSSGPGFTAQPFPALNGSPSADVDETVEAWTASARNAAAAGNVVLPALRRGLVPGRPRARPLTAMGNPQPAAPAPRDGTGPAQSAESARGAPEDPVPRALTAVAVLLTIGSAATDVACFTRLGSVFASVMTSNIVFLGLSAAQHSGGLAIRAGIGVIAYVTGVATASRLARTGQRASGPASAGGPSERPWSPWIAATLISEILLLGAFTIGWEATGARPAGGVQILLLALAALAMGMQSGVVTVMGLAGVSTTYLTGTLTALIDSLASPRSRPGANGRRIATLCALAAGAGLSGLLLGTVPAAVPAVPLVMLGGVIGTGLAWLRPRSRPAPEHDV